MASSLFRAASFLHSTRLLPKALNGSSSFLRRLSTYVTPTEEDIVSISRDCIQASPPNFKSANTPGLSVFQHPKAKDFSCFDQFRIASRILDTVCTFPHIDTKEVNKDTDLEKDLGLDFFGRWDIVDGIRWMFRLYDIKPILIDSGFKTVKQIVDYLCSHLHETWVPDQDSRNSIHEDYIKNFRLKEYSVLTITPVK